MLERYIIHIDMDAFFAAVEMRDNPLLKGKPVVIGSDPKGGHGRGVVSTASYEARKFGIHSAMPISTAYKRCPNAVFIRPNMEKYSAVSRQIYNIFLKFTPDIEPIGIDEAFLDITGSYHLFGSPEDVCRLIKNKIKEETELTASCGLAPTKMAAKIASDLKKPDGLVIVTRDHLLDFLWPLPIGKLWGVGKKSEIILRGIGIETIGDLAHKPKDELLNILGKSGEDLWGLAHGIDERLVEAGREAKSISQETTFDTDTYDDDLVKRSILGLSEEVSRRLRHETLKARTITIKIRLTGFETFTRSRTLDTPTNFCDEIYQTALELYRDFRQEHRKRVRLIGVRASNFTGNNFRTSLFEKDGDGKKERVYTALDKLNEKFGDGIVYRAGSRE